MKTSKFQHHVFYVNDLQRSKDFYMQLFDLQFSALNHPDSSAAMRMSQQEMHFFSFGEISRPVNAYLITLGGFRLQLEYTIVLFDCQS